jgi:hypothetical protein
MMTMMILTSRNDGYDVATRMVTGDDYDMTMVTIMAVTAWW